MKVTITSCVRTRRLTGTSTHMKTGATAVQHPTGWSKHFPTAAAGTPLLRLIACAEQRANAGERVSIEESNVSARLFLSIHVLFSPAFGRSPAWAKLELMGLSRTI